MCHHPTGLDLILGGTGVWQGRAPVPQYALRTHVKDLVKIYLVKKFKKMGEIKGFRVLGFRDTHDVGAFGPKP